MPFSRTEPTRHFPTEIQRAKFDGRYDNPSLVERGKSDFANAPTADPVKDGANHGIVVESHYQVMGNGQHGIRIKYADGYEHQSRHPEQFRAHQMITRAMGLEESPPAIRTHMRSRAHPVGQKEDERLAREDHREVEEEGEDES